MDSREAEYYQWNQRGDPGQRSDAREWRGNGESRSWDSTSSSNVAGAYTDMEWTGGEWEFRESSGGSYSAEPYREWERDPMTGDPVKDGDPISGEDPKKSGSVSFTPGMDVDGEPVELCEDDQELTRKKKELQLIEEKIILKRASIAIKQIQPILKAMNAGEKKSRKFSEDVKEDFTKKQMPERLKDVPFKERVNGILLKRKKPQDSDASARPAAAVLYQLIEPPKVAKSFVERMNASILNKDDQLWKDSQVQVQEFKRLCKKRQVQEPRSADVVALLCSRPREGEEEHPLKRRVKSLMEGRHNPVVALSSNEKVLEVAPRQDHVKPAPEQDPAAKGFQRFLSILNKGVDIDLMSKIVNDIPAVDEELLQARPELAYRNGSLGSHSGAPQNDHSRSQSGERRMDETRLDDQRSALSSNERTSSSSSSGSKSPAPVVVKTEVISEDEQKYGQMQDLLQTIGLDLGLEEMGKLTDRIQERLYGKKETEREPRGSTVKQEELPHQHPQGKASRDSGEGNSTFKRSNSSDGDRDADLSHPQPNPACPASHPAHAISDYTPAQPPQDVAQHGSRYPDAESPGWGYRHDATFPSAYPAGYPPYPPDPSYGFNGATAASGHAHAYHQPPDYHPAQGPGFQGPHGDQCNVAAEWSQPGSQAAPTNATKRYLTNIPKSTSAASVIGTVSWQGDNSFKYINQDMVGYCGHRNMQVVGPPAAAGHAHAYHQPPAYHPAQGPGFQGPHGDQCNAHPPPGWPQPGYRAAPAVAPAVAPFVLPRVRCLLSVPCAPSAPSKETLIAMARTEARKMKRQRKLQRQQQKPQKKPQLMMKMKMKRKKKKKKRLWPGDELWEMLPGYVDPEARAKNSKTLPVPEIEPEPVETKAVETEAVGTEAVGTEAVGTEAVGTEAVGTEAVETKAVETEAVETESAGWYRIQNYTIKLF